MPIQTYLCHDHGEFEIFQAFADEVMQVYRCPHPVHPVGRRVTCGRDSQYVLKPIAAAIVQGGTGGGKDMHLPR